MVTTSRQAGNLVPHFQNSLFATSWHEKKRRFAMNGFNFSEDLVGVTIRLCCSFVFHCKISLTVQRFLTTFSLRWFLIFLGITTFSTEKGGGWGRQAQQLQLNLVDPRKDKSSRTADSRWNENQRRQRDWLTRLPESHLERMQPQTQEFIFLNTQSSELGQWILDSTAKRHGMTQEGWVLTKLILRQKASGLWRNSTNDLLRSDYSKKQARFTFQEKFHSDKIILTFKQRIHR